MSAGGDLEVEARRVSSWSLRLEGVAVHAFIVGVWLLTVVVVASEAPDAVAAWWGLAALTALAALQLAVFARPSRPPRRATAHMALLAEAVLVFAPYVAFGDWWAGNPGMLTGSMLLVLPPRARVVGVAVVSGSLGWLTFLFARGPYLVVFQVVDPVFTGLVLFGLTRLAQTVRELQATRHELAEMAVAEHRWRFAQELQRRVGDRLSTVMARVRGPVEAPDGVTPGSAWRITDALSVTREALADVRALVREGTADHLDAAWHRRHRVADLPRMSRRLANGVLVAVLVGFGVMSFTWTLALGAGPTGAAVGFLDVAALVVIQLLWFGRAAARKRRAASVAMLVVQATLLYLLVQFGGVWLDLTGFLAGSLLLVLRPAAALPLAAVVIGSVGWIGTALTDDPLRGLMQMVTAAITALVVYSLTHLAGLVGALHEARATLARKAVVDEGLRFSRDLHDLLGLSLSAIAVKLELATRLQSRGDATAAERELDDVVDLARRGIGDARSVAGGGVQRLALDDELDSAASVLAPAGVDVRIHRDVGTVPASLHEPLALAVREGATNVLRHARAAWCDIELRHCDDALTLEIRNDGASPGGTDGVGTTAGHGLANLTHRVHEVGGALASGRQPDGVFRLRVTVPVEDRPLAEEPALARRP